MLSDSKRTREFDTDDITSIESTVIAARERAAKLQLEIDELEAQIKMARGTVNIPHPAPKVVPPTPPPTLEARVETALRTNVFALDELGKFLGEPTGKIAAVLKNQRKNLYNLGTSDRARWTWRIGDQTPTDVLVTLIARLISNMPLTTAELVEATGARPGRVSGALVALQRTEHVLDLGTKNKRRWFLVAAHARDARLAPKVRGEK